MEKTTTRYALTLGTNGMVIGDGATADEARMDAINTSKAAGSDVETSLDSAQMTTYDATTHEVRMDGGIVRICRLPWS